MQLLSTSESRWKCFFAKFVFRDYCIHLHTHKKGYAEWGTFPNEDLLALSWLDAEGLAKMWPAKAVEIILHAKADKPFHTKT